MGLRMERNAPRCHGSLEYQASHLLGNDGHAVFLGRYARLRGEATVGEREGEGGKESHAHPHSSPIKLKGRGKREGSVGGQGGKRRGGRRNRETVRPIPRDQALSGEAWSSEDCVFWVGRRGRVGAGFVAHLHLNSVTLKTCSRFQTLFDDAQGEWARRRDLRLKGVDGG
ncbi:hypothetical protein IE53DRAFT_278381 [Violaceomyces palustris]|uniref:Uncharacterized protein n=1 Tax=Violaceomyces palustris TaxID=1673888 RepID=A0ACD0NMG3_9BASI|nr:hypothetical protein IE53DRAFT_278381 [Violaceomyces palustris]